MFHLTNDNTCAMTFVFITGKVLKVLQYISVVRQATEGQGSDKLAQHLLHW